MMCCLVLHNYDMLRKGKERVLFLQVVQCHVKYITDAFFSQSFEDSLVTNPVDFIRLSVNAIN